MVVSRMFFLTHFPWPFSMKSVVLRLFGATVGKGLVIKPHVNIKYPWNLEIGDHTWIGEGVWIDSLGKIKLGNNVCLSQGAMIETGNHDWSDTAFGLIVADVIVEDGAWAAVRSVLLPGSRLTTHCVLGAGAVLSGVTEPFSIYSGNPAVKVGERVVKKSLK
jgi:putative colanic acid biosynthesis acetyltransferase WcaF